MPPTQPLRSRLLLGTLLIAVIGLTARANALHPLPAFDLICCGICVICIAIHLFSAPRPTA